MADKNNTKKKGNGKETVKEKKKVSPKIFIIIGAAIAALVLTLFLIFDDGLPKNVKEGIEATVQTKLGCEIDSLKAQKKFRVKDSEYDKETIYLVKGVLKGTDKFVDGYSVALLVAVIEDGGEKRVVCKTVAMDSDKAAIKIKIKELKKTTDTWSAEIKKLNELAI